MGKQYFLMRKNEIITLVQFNDSGKMTAFSKNLTEQAMDLAPLAYRNDKDNWLKKWWDDRSIPVTRDQIQSLLSNMGFSTPDQYLIKNLGLSLTDYYWIKPVDSDLTWEKVNLFDNDFHENILLSHKHTEDGNIPRYTPNGSLQGNIEKTWTIADGKRCLLKGNHSNLSSESFNEIIASHIHKKQKYDNYTKYDLIRIKGKPYKYGCISEAFTSQKLELISAWAVCTSERKADNTSYYEHFIRVCKKHGIDEDLLRRDLEYQIMSDYIMSGYDRHLNNISVLRDSDSLRFIRMAPIYDSGDSLFANRAIPLNIHELQKMEISSFAKTESKQLKYVKDRSLLDVSKLPSPDLIKKTYHKDDMISETYINKISEWYERKIDIFSGWQKKQ